MEKENIRALLIKPFEDPVRVVIENTLDTFQGLVGGYIQSIKPVMHDDSAVIICNEEGKLLHLPHNRPLIGNDGMAYDIIRGNMIVVDAPEGTVEFGSLSDEQFEKYTRLYEC